MRQTFWLAAPTAMLLMMTGCSEPRPLNVDGGYVRLNANPAAPSAGYFTIHGGPAAVVLRDVTTDAAVRVEMHESKTQDGVTSMAAIDTVDVPAGATIKFEPGGKHLMLWQINPQAVAAGKMTFTFIFSNGDRILADAVIEQPAGAAQDEHNAH
ncbi:MAG TPA: copper chaperone PCu(A)C [Sphingobium sp.]|nr:copper chaperone PCu(A)C [Sphingobium sp.]